MQKQQKRNYQRELEGIIEKLCEGEPPKLFLHSCCAPCSSYCIEYLCRYFALTVFYYNPNITEEAEYRHRAEEQKRLITCYNQEIAAGERVGYRIEVKEGEYEIDRFLSMSHGLEECPEGGERCSLCFRLRLEESARKAKENGAEYFCTTLSISPLKNAEKLNRIGEELAEKYGVRWLPSDFKKKGGYQRSVELSSEYGLYRQNYCGCGFSKRDALVREERADRAEAGERSEKGSVGETV